jgi:hypothetical protein
LTLRNTSLAILLAAILARAISRFLGWADPLEADLLLPLAGLCGLLILTLRSEEDSSPDERAAASPGQSSGADQAQSRETR